MSANPLIDQGMAVFTSVAALKLKRAEFRHTSEGVEIHQPGKPVLLLTHEAAMRFANEVAEAENQ